jgi:hypothetical protein
MKPLRLFVSALALVALTAAPLAAECKPVVGSFEARVVSEGCTSPVGLCTAGRVWGGIQGTYAFAMTALFPSGAVPTILFFTGDSTVTLKDGAEVKGKDTGSIDMDPSRGGFASLITFDTGATGQIRLRGKFDPVAGTTAGDYAGTLCTP